MEYWEQVLVVETVVGFDLQRDTLIQDTGGYTVLLLILQVARSKLTRSHIT